ncbi:MAG: O-succinylhomoserine sulfhydrylase [Bacteroidia bacterium]|nr:O-succinylhomoserine sulfhydrylase [Bacteroidia bacterium]
MRPESNAIRIQTERSNEGEHSTPIFLTSSFVFDNAEEMRAAFADEKDVNIYSRFSNPNVTEFEQKLAALEETEDCFATASGMSAITASFLAFLKAGDHLLACSSIFGSTHTVITKYLTRWGIEYTYADINKPETWEALIRPNTKMIFAETPTNPGLDLVNLEWLGQLARKHKIILNIDNCFATPALQQPAKYGADIVTHSATKFIDGQGRVMGGAVCGRKDLVKEVYLFCRATGPSLSPFNAWVLSKSLETLHVRMERHSENALKLAGLLEHHPSVKSVKYPWLLSHPQYEIARKQMKAGGGVVTFELKGGLEQGRRFLDAIKMCSLTANLGDTRTTVTHPASTTHAKLTEAERLSTGITPGLVRISVGLEHITDIVSDLEQALELSK